MKRSLTLDQRQLKEIKFNLFYARQLAHGTDGHNLRLLNASFALAFGFDFNSQGDLTFNDQPLTFVDGMQLTVTWNSETTADASA